MALQFIFGPSGSGKSNYIYNKIIQESMENPDRQYLVLVPEQFYHADSEGTGHAPSQERDHEY